MAQKTRNMPYSIRVLTLPVKKNMVCLGHFVEQLPHNTYEFGLLYCKTALTS